MFLLAVNARRIEKFINYYWTTLLLWIEIFNKSIRPNSNETQIEMNEKSERTMNEDEHERNGSRCRSACAVVGRAMR